MNIFNEKNVLVTGGAGFVGTNLILKLLEKGARVRATLHSKEPLIFDSRIEFIKCDLENKDDCFKVCKGMDFVFLCAANTSGAAVMEKTPLVHLTPNLIMNARMLEAAYASGVEKLLFISTNTVYPLTDYPVKEEDCTNEFYDKYFIVGWMKRFSEIVCEMYSSKIRKPMETIVVRPGNIYGPYDKFDWETSHVLPALIRRVVERHNPMVVWGNGEDIKDFIYVDDFIEGMLKIFQKFTTFDVVNIAGGIPYRLKDLLYKITEIDCFRDANIQFDSSKPTMIPIRLIDTGKAFEKYDFKACIPIEEGLRKTIEWYRKNYLKQLDS